jgi:hypothetical protein
MMAPERPDDKAGSKAPAKPEESGIDFSRYRMNPVQIEESEEAARAVPRRIGAYVALLVILAAAALAVVAWNRHAAEMPWDKSPDPEHRQRAQDLRDNVTQRIASLQGFVYDMQFVSATKINIFVNPSILEKSGAERPITDEEVERATQRVTKEFHALGPRERTLTVDAYVVQNPGLASQQQPMAIGTYDADTDSVSVRLTAQIPVPGGTGKGEATGGEGNLGSAHGSAGPHE